MNISPPLFQKLILTWFDEHGRKHLPWQKNKSAYSVWISEIMLQQTQVNTVIPYFEKFIKQFPSLSSLANASEDEVLHLWTGLGYYSRARNLLAAAKMIIKEFKGKFPENIDDAKSLPGIGRSTAAAVLSLAYNQNTPILDGNVKRVLTRFQGIQQPINDKKTENILWEIAEYFMPAKRAADYTQAMMDLGATVCVRSKPLCPKCPLKRYCLASKQEIQHLLPIKKSTKKIPTRYTIFFIFQKSSFLLLRKRPPLGIWGGLWSFPEIMDVEASEENIKHYCRQHFQMQVKEYQLLPAFKHSFSHYHLQIFPVIIPIKRLTAKIMEAHQQIWYNLDEQQPLGLPKPVQLIIKNCESTVKRR